ncbi:MAG TPA: hypothetical protein VE974_02700 [Thermoanaerobaculia bacterium]|nr:hypothetical protein [Thermoanaerobaculia bacterium]
MIEAVALSLAFFATTTAAAGEPMSKSCPMHAQHMAAAKAEAVQADGSAEHGRHVDDRHDAFGMSHTKSTHSFRLFADGGAIELRATDPADAATAAAIREHLQAIDEEFGTGDFSTPRFVHGYPPDGVAQLERLRDRITYRYQQLDGGGRIRITTKSADALAAVHAFLRFQVIEHRTANSGEVEEDDVAP